MAREEQRRLNVYVTNKKPIRVESNTCGYILICIFIAFVNYFVLSQ